MTKLNEISITNKQYRILMLIKENFPLDHTGRENNLAYLSKQGLVDRKRHSAEYFITDKGNALIRAFKES